MSCSKEVESTLFEEANLVKAVQSDYPQATEILVSYPEEWELVQKIKKGAGSLYIAAMPPKEERPYQDRFYGLSPEINLALTTYRLYRFYRPWPTPDILISWDEAREIGEVIGSRGLKIQLQQLGQAQAWYGQKVGVIWECYLNEVGRKTGWQEEIDTIWQTVEKDMAVPKIFTPPREPTWGKGYPEFLRHLGYAPDTVHSRWWSK